MKQFFYILVLVLSVNSSVFAQAKTTDADIKIEGFTAKIEQRNLLINWTSAEAGDKFWAVQGSADGKSYTTVGYVMGQNPAAGANVFSFKQPVAKIKPGLKYYRVLLMETAETGMASNTVNVSK